MSEDKRKYDITVFGASGVTGEYVIEELAVYHNDLRWCVAGRNRGKLQKILRKIGQGIDKDLTNVDIVEADASDEDSLASMCTQTLLLLSIVGPYRFSGEKIVDHCVKAGTHYIDVSGEPQFLETIQLKYFEEAKNRGLFIVGSCGFDSIPYDLGVELLRKKFDGDLNSIESFISFNVSPDSTINYATWQSAVHGLAHAAELKPLRRSLKEKIFPAVVPKSAYPLKQRSTLFKSELVNKWCLPFLGSDKSVATRTQLFNHQFKKERPIQLGAYFTKDSLFNAMFTILGAAMFMLLVKFSFGRTLLEKFPEVFSFGLFSSKPPKKEKPGSRSFRITFKAVGWKEKLLDAADTHSETPNKELVAVLSGSDGAYTTTAICAVNSAKVLLNEKDKMPFTGGVFTPAAAFSDTTLAEKLEKRGLTLTIQE